MSERQCVRLLHCVAFLVALTENEMGIVVVVDSYR